MGYASNHTSTGMIIVKSSVVIQKFAEFSHLPAIATAGWRNGRTLYRPFSKIMSTSTTKFWLLKAEPETRIVKGKNVQVGSKSTYRSDCCSQDCQDCQGRVK